MAGPKRSFKVPTSFVAGKRIRINGTVYQPGDVIPNAVIKTLKKLSALVSSRRILPNADPHGRKTLLETPAPTDFSAKVRKGLPG